jgi:hypothetical protein
MIIIIHQLHKIFYMLFEKLEFFWYDLFSQDIKQETSLLYHKSYVNANFKIIILVNFEVELSYLRELIDAKFLKFLYSKLILVQVSIIRVVIISFLVLLLVIPNNSLIINDYPLALKLQIVYKSFELLFPLRHVSLHYHLCSMFNNHPIRLIDIILAIRDTEITYNCNY